MHYQCSTLSRCVVCILHLAFAGHSILGSQHQNLRWLCAVPKTGGLQFWDFFNELWSGTDRQTCALWWNYEEQQLVLERYRPLHAPERGSHWMGVLLDPPEGVVADKSNVKSCNFLMSHYADAQTMWELGFAQPRVESMVFIRDPFMRIISAIEFEAHFRQCTACVSATLDCTEAEAYLRNTLLSTEDRRYARHFLGHHKCIDRQRAYCAKPPMLFEKCCALPRFGCDPDGSTTGTCYETYNETGPTVLDEDASVQSESLVEHAQQRLCSKAFIGLTHSFERSVRLLAFNLGIGRNLTARLVSAHGNALKTPRYPQKYLECDNLAEAFAETQSVETRIYTFARRVAELRLAIFERTQRLVTVHKPAAGQK
jgi:hypothetical protein